MDNKETLLDLKRKKQESKRKYKKKVGIEVIFCGIVSLISMVYISHAGSDLFSVLSGGFLSFIVSGVFPFKTGLEWLLDDSNYDVKIAKLEKEIKEEPKNLVNEKKKTSKEMKVKEYEVISEYSCSLDKKDSNLTNIKYVDEELKKEKVKIKK